MDKKVTQIAEAREHGKSRYVAQLEAIVDEGGTVTNANVRDLVDLVDGDVEDMVMELLKCWEKEHFHHLLETLINLNYYEVEEVVSEEEWTLFVDNPWEWFILAEDHQSEFIWRKMIAEKGGKRMIEKAYSPLILRVRDLEICQTCHGNGYVRREGEVEQCSTCDSEGEYELRGGS